MPQSIKERMPMVESRRTESELTALLQAILIDLAAFRTTFNAHVHGGVTTGASNTAVSTTLLTAAGELRA